MFWLHIVNTCFHVHIHMFIRTIIIKKFGPVLLTEFTFPNYNCLHVTDLGGIGKLQLQKQFEVIISK